MPLKNIILNHVVRSSLLRRVKGGEGSGHWEHAGRPGKRGGSLPGKQDNFENDFFKSQQELDEVTEKVCRYMKTHMISRSETPDERGAYWLTPDGYYISNKTKRGWHVIHRFSRKDTPAFRRERNCAFLLLVIELVCG